MKSDSIMKAGETVRISQVEVRNNLGHDVVVNVISTDQSKSFNKIYVYLQSAPKIEGDIVRDNDYDILDIKETNV